MTSTTLKNGRVGVTTIVYRATSLQLSSTNLGGVTRVQIVQRADNPKTIVRLSLPSLTTISSAPTGPRGLTGAGIDTFEYNLATLYQIGKL